ncbi:MAG: HlyD family efflux transporter periplasmic adaptor subunit [Phycisphaerae bacterium]|nr:HlyD family efflux transporter periplasmic adaptor subunit [Phycisphaerae bacterium]
MNRLKELEIAALIETDRVRLEFLRLQMAVLSKLQAQQTVSNLTSREAEAECRAIEKSVQENEKTLAQARLDLAQARQRQEAFEKNHVVPQQVDQVLEPLRAAITVQERLMEELGIRREMLVLKSPMDGVVQQVWLGPGESAWIGEPVLTVVSPRPFAVVAYATADQVGLLESGSPVRSQVARDGGDRQSKGSHVVAIGPMAEKPPTQLWRNPTVPEWGWPVKIAVPPTLGVLCGQMVGVCRR